MLFNSYIFIFCFLPLVVIGYYGINHFKTYKLGLIFLLGMSLWFYGYFNIYYLAIILSSVGINYGIYKWIEKSKSPARIPLCIGLIADIGILIYFKYMDFFIGNINAVFKTNLPLLHIVLPLGISFFTFQQISFVVDAYKKEVPNYGFLEYACFVTFFPQLVAGPIVTHDELVPQFKDITRKRINWESFASGIIIFVLGFSKKVLLADTFGVAVDAGFANIDALNSGSALLVMLGYTLQIYFDFSGYSDMAIGLGRMLNLELPRNFNSPYKALDIGEFWDRWHMTLTRFLTRYVYIPLGGNRKGTTRTYINIMVVFLVSGFWHGANWTFIVWGLIHGLLSVLTRISKNMINKVPKIIRFVVTYFMVNVLWLIFRATSISEAWSVIRKIFAFDFGGIPEKIYSAFNRKELVFMLDKFKLVQQFPMLLMVLFYIFAMAVVLWPKNTYDYMNVKEKKIGLLIILVILFVWGVLSLSGVSDFLYFNF